MNGTIRAPHGMTGTQLYRKWRSIKEVHGRRKGMVAPEWLVSFTAFRAYVGDPPTPTHRLRRVDDKLPFMPGNVHWVEVPAREPEVRPERVLRAWWEM